MPKSARLARSVDLVHEAQTRHEQGDCVKADCHYWHGHGAYKLVDDLDSCAFCSEPLYGAPHGEDTSGADPEVVISRSCPHAVHASCYRERRESAEGDDAARTADVISSLCCVPCAADGRVSAFAVCCVAGFNVRSMRQRQALVDVQQARQFLQTASSDTVLRLVECGMSRSDCYAAFAFQAHDHPAIEDCVFLHEGDTRDTATLASSDSIPSALFATSGEDGGRYRRARQYDRRSDAGPAGVPTSPDAPVTVSAPASTLNLSRRASVSSAGLETAAAAEAESGGASSGQALSLGWLNRQMNALTEVVERERMERERALEAQSEAHAAAMEKERMEREAQSEAHAAAMEKELTKHDRQLDTVFWRLGFMWSALMTNGFLGHTARVIKQTRLVFLAHVAFTVGTHISPVEKDPNSPRTWGTGRVLVPLGRLPPAPRSEAEGGGPARWDPDELARALPTVPSAVLAGMFEAVQTEPRGAVPAAKQGGVFGLTLVVGDGVVREALRKEQTIRRRDVATKRAGRQPPDRDAGDAAQPLLRGIDMSKAWGGLAGRFGCVRQADFLTDFMRRRNEFSHGDDDTSVSWQKDQTLPEFAAALLGKIRSLHGTTAKLRAMSRPTRGAGPGASAGPVGAPADRATESAAAPPARR